MAGMWRLSLESVEGLSLRTLMEVARNAFNALNRRSGFEEEDTESTQIIVEVDPGVEGAEVLRSRPRDVSDDGVATIKQVLFVPAPPPGAGITLRVLKFHRLLAHSLIGEARVTEASGSCRVELMRKGKVRATLRFTATAGLPFGQPAASPMSVTSSLAPAAGAATPIYSRTPGGSLPSEAASASDRVSIGGRDTPAAVVSGSPGLLAAPPMAVNPRQGLLHKLDQASPTSNGSFANSRAAAAKPGNAAGGRAGRSPVAPTGPRRLRTRPPNLPLIGNCDVTITEVSGLEGLRDPYFILGVEGFEFRVDSVGDLSRQHPRNLCYNFPIGSINSGVQLYVYENAAGGHLPLGRILIPIADVLWPSGEGFDISRAKAGFERVAEPYEKSYFMRFLPVSERGDGVGSVAFWDTYGFAALDGSALDSAPQGAVSLRLEVSLCSEAQPLLSFYMKSLFAGVRRVMQLGEKGGPSVARNRSRSVCPVLDASLDEAQTAQELVRSAEFQSVVQSVERLQHYMEGNPPGLLRWIRKKPTNGYIAAGAWFFFCFMGFFPCSVAMLPIYAWLLLALNGVVAMSQRRKDWTRWSATDADPKSSQPQRSPTGSSPHEASPISAVLAARWQESFRRAEPLLVAYVGYKTRLLNLFTFADGAASTASFALLAVAAVVLSFYCWVLSIIDPGMHFMSGLYGAAALAGYAKASAANGREEPLWRSWAFNEIFACVPDDLQAVHRFVSTRVQRCDV